MAQADELIAGRTRVVLTDRCKRDLMLNDCSDHVEEFGGCVGVILGPVDWGQKTEIEEDPTFDVRWLPSKLRYMYKASYLRVVDNDDT